MKTGIKKYLAYGIAQAGDTVPYCMFYTFFIYFLTDNVGLPPAVAGAISLIAVCWDGITDPIVGFLTDHSRNPKGRRRPWMIKSIFPLTVTIFLMFAPFEFSSTVFATIYYVVIAATFWTLYTTYVIPYMSLGAEITADYKGRNYIRMFNMVCGGIYMLICTSGPYIVQAWGVEHGFSDRGAWGISGAVFGLMALILSIIGWYFTKGTENPLAEEIIEKEKKEGVFTVFKETFAIRPYRKLCLATFFFFIGNIAAGSAMVYLLSYNCGLDAAQNAAFWIVYAVAYTLLVPIGTGLSNLMGKKRAFIFGQTITIILCVICFIVKIDSFFGSCVYITVFQFGATLFWTNYLAFAYDCAEIDEYKNGKRREGSLCAIVSFAQKLGSAVGTYTIGIMLTIVGYDAMAEVQTAPALDGILALCTLLPAAGAFIAILFMLKYPVGPKEYELIVKAVEDKKAGKDVDEAPFAECLK